MPITRIEVSNFKTFDSLDVRLDSFNVIIGANASGKSNFVSVLKFLKDIADSGLDNAMSMQGGVEYVRNMKTGSSKELTIRVHATPPSTGLYPISFSHRKGSMTVDGQMRDFVYAFSIAFGKKRGFKIASEILTITFDIVELRKASAGKDEPPLGQELKVIATRKGGKFTLTCEPSDMQVATYEVIPPFVKLGRQLIIETPYSYVLSISNRFFRDIGVFDLDPRFSKRTTLITGKTELEPDGSNLAITLKHIIDNKKEREKMQALAKELLPFVVRLKVQKLADKSLLATMKEAYSESFLPATLVSDGTINVTALLIALFFEKKSIIVVEEPEKNLHPYLASKIVDIMKDVADKSGKQVIVTTHSPDLVKYSGVRTLLLISRGDDGFSVVSRPEEKDEVRAFLEHKMGVEELYVQNLLE